MFLLLVVAVLVILQFLATLTLPRGTSLANITNTIQFVLACLATGIFLVNSLRSRGALRIFWGLFAASWSALSFSQAVWIYYEGFLLRPPPGIFLGDVLLFLGATPILAALLLQTQPRWWKGRYQTGLVDFALLLVWWLYLYSYFVAPWQFVQVDESRYNAYYNTLDAAGDAAILILTGYLFRRASAGWRRFYGVFFCSQLLLSVGSYLANSAIDRHTYFSGSLYDLPFTTALGSFTLVGLTGRSLIHKLNEHSLLSPLPLSRLGMFSLLSLPVITAASTVIQKVSLPVRRFRELVVQCSILLMGSLIFFRQRRLMEELAESKRVLEYASVTDSLTGCHNRRFLDAALPLDAARALRSYESRADGHAQDLIFFLIDLDNFKEVNDRNGHPIGDRALVAVTDRIKSVVRKSDIVVRWGGDEFLVLSRNCDRTEASRFCRRILDAVEAPIATGAGITSAIRQTCSIGWAAYPWHPQQPDDLDSETVLGLADRGLYQAKTSGKNQAVGVVPSGLNGARFETTYPTQHELHPTRDRQSEEQFDLATILDFSRVEFAAPGVKGPC